MVKPPLKSKTSIRQKAKAKTVAKNDSWKRRSLIRPWARKSALDVFQAFSTGPVKEIPGVASGK